MSDPPSRPAYKYGRPTEDDVPAISALVSWAFASPPDDALAWVKERIGLRNLRVLRREGRVACCLAVLPMGQWFGNVSVPAAGIAAVATAPELRGRGLAAELLSHVLLDLYDDGFPVAPLYPSAQALYRRCGWEQAGSRFEVRVPTSALDPKVLFPEVRPMEEGDLDDVKQLYRGYASVFPGYLDRNDYIWHRVLRSRGVPSRVYVSGRQREIEGYVVLTPEGSQNAAPYDLRIADIVATSPESGRRLLSFLGQHRSLASHVVWHGGPSDFLLMHLAEPSYQLALKNRWMLRIVDVATALEARGYPGNMWTELHLDVRDEQVPRNDARFTLEVAAGRAVVQRGGKGRLRMDIRALAALYTGYQSPAALQAAGMIEGPDSQIAAAHSIFACPHPSMPDMF